MTQTVDGWIRLERFAAAYATAWSSQSPASVAAFFSEAGSLKVNDAAPAVGRAAIADLARSFMSAFPDLRVTFDQLGGGEAQPVFHWTLTGTETGPGGSGRAVKISGYEIWQIGTDGLIARSLGHFDEAEYRRQLGAG